MFTFRKIVLFLLISGICFGQLSVIPDPFAPSGLTTSKAGGVSGSGAAGQVTLWSGATSTSGSSNLTTNFSAISTPSAPTVSPVGSSTGASWKYGIIVLNAIGNTPVSALTTGSGGTDMPDMSNYWTVTYPTSSGNNCAIYRDVNGDDPGLLFTGVLVDASGTVIQHACDGSTFNDTGFQSFQRYWLAGTQPSIPVALNTTTGEYIAPRVSANAIGFGANVGTDPINFAAGPYSYATSTNGGGMAIGPVAYASATQSPLAVGPFTISTGNQSVAIGVGNKSSANGALSIGTSAIADATYGVAIGYAVHAGSQFSVCISADCIDNGANTFTVGGVAADSFINDWYGGRAEATAKNLTIHAAPVTGMDVAGGDISIAGGQGTGAGATGAVRLKVAPAGGSGTSANALVDALVITKVAGSASAAVCWKTTTTLGFCSSVVGAGGTCTCN